MSKSNIFKRGNRYHAWVKNERGETVRVSTGCRDKQAAEAWYRNYEREALDPESAAKASARLSHALELLITHADSKARANPPKGSKATVEFYQKKSGVLMSVLAPNWDPAKPNPDDDLPLRSVTAPVVDGYIGTRRKDGVKETTIAKELTTWSLAMKHAARAGMWDGDVKRVFPVAFAPGYVPVERWMTPSEWLKLLQAAEAHDKPEGYIRNEARRSRVGILAAVAFMVATSAEWCAVWRAKPEDVDLVDWTVHVRGTKDAQKGGNRDRVIPVVDLRHAFLLVYAMRHADGGTLLFRERPNFRRDLKVMCKLAGIPSLSPNDLRRTHATWLVASGVHTGHVAPVMGHADSRMVERVYGRVRPVSLRQVMSKAISQA